MKKRIYGLLAVAAALATGCSEDTLPTASLDLFQVEAVKALAGDQTATVSWTTQEGKPAPLDFYVCWTADNAEIEGGEKSVSADQRQIVVDGLVNDCTYTFTVQSHYPNGLAQKISAVCTPKTSRFAATDFTASAGSERVLLKWTKPRSDKFTGYTLTWMPSNGKATLSDKDAEQYMVEKLTNGTTYTFSLVCTYTNGESDPVRASATPGKIDPILVESTTLVQNQPCTFEYNPMYFISGEVASASWDFGDGSASADLIARHAYAATGDYTVKVTVTYTNNQTDQAGISMKVIGYMWSSAALTSGSYTGAVKASNPVFSPDGSTVYIPTSNKRGDLFAVDAYTGQIKWVFAIADNVTYGGGAAVGPDGTIYQGARDSKMYAITSGGAEKWSFTSAGQINCFPAVTSDGKLYFCSNGTTNAMLYAKDAATGSEIWTKELEGGVGSAVAVDAAGNVYAGSNKAIWSYTEGGDLRWKSSQELNVTEAGSFAISGTTLYAALKGGGGVASVNMADGRVNWTSGFATGDSYFPIADKDGTVFFTDKGSKNVFAVAPNGSKKWEASAGAALIYAGLALSDDGKLYAGTQGKNAADTYVLMGIEASNGNVFLNESSDEQIMSAFTIGPDKRLYYGSVAGYLNTREINAGLEPSGWSMRGGNVQGTNSLK